MSNRQQVGGEKYPSPSVFLPVRLMPAVKANQKGRQEMQLWCLVSGGTEEAEKSSEWILLGWMEAENHGEPAFQQVTPWLGVFVSLT